MTRYHDSAAITAGGPVLRVYNPGCFGTTIEQETRCHSKNNESFCYGRNVENAPHRYADDPVNSHNILIAFSNSVNTYCNSGLTIEGYGTIPDRTVILKAGGNTGLPVEYFMMLPSCRYKNNNSFFRWRSDGSKTIISELQVILGKDLELDAKVKALCGVLSRNLMRVGKGLRNIFVVNELLDPNFSRMIRLSRYVVNFLDTQVEAQEIQDFSPGYHRTFLPDYHRTHVSSR